METKYEVLPKPATSLTEGIVEAYKGMEIRLEALYEGKDPYSKEETVKPEEVDL